VQQSTTPDTVGITPVIAGLAERDIFIPGITVIPQSFSARVANNGFRIQTKTA
jgi:hypothetical protein